MAEYEKRDLRKKSRKVDEPVPKVEEETEDDSSSSQRRSPLPRRRRQVQKQPRDTKTTEKETKEEPKKRPTTYRSRQRRPPTKPAASRSPRPPASRSPRPTTKTPTSKARITTPVIGITCSFRNFPTGDKHECEYFYLYEPYVNAIHQAGGVPIIIPVGLEGRYTNKVFELINGLMITGGGDIDPNHYGDLLTTKLMKVDPRKDRTEIDLFNLAFNKNMPVLGICRGAQLMNVALDGTLFQDIVTQVRMAINHNPDFPFNEVSHKVKVNEESRLHKALGETQLQVNSIHHQGIKLHGKGLVVSAEAPDGIVEGIEHPSKKWVIGVQWHPELMWMHDKIQAKLFKAFIEACKS